MRVTNIKIDYDDIGHQRPIVGAIATCVEGPELGTSVEVHSILTPEEFEDLQTLLTTIEVRLAGKVAISKDDFQPFPISVNGRDHLVNKNVLTYEDVVTLAGLNPKRVLTVVYKGVAGRKTEGTISPGRFIRGVIPGTRFTVADTSGA